MFVGIIAGLPVNRKVDDFRYADFRIPMLASSISLVNDVMTRLFRHYMPDNPPIHTLGVAALGDPKMRFEIRVTAVLPD